MTKVKQSAVVTNRDSSGLEAVVTVAIPSGGDREYGCGHSHKSSKSADQCLDRMVERWSR